jgi:hypothetical protein
VPHSHPPLASPDKPRHRWTAARRASSIRAPLPHEIAEDDDDARTIDALVASSHENDLDGAAYHAREMREILEDRRDRVIDMRVGELVAAGMPEDDARAAARQWFRERRSDVVRAIAVWRSTEHLAHCKLRNIWARRPQPHQVPRRRSFVTITVARQGHARSRERRARRAGVRAGPAGDPDSPGDHEPPGVGRAYRRTRRRRARRVAP